MTRIDPPGDAPSVTVYWRRRCPYCVRLRWHLRRSGLPVHEVNIWEDESAVATVRSINRGDETVPTVVVGTRSLVNPNMRETLDAVRDEAPHLLARATTVGHARRRRYRAAMGGGGIALSVGAAAVVARRADSPGRRVLAETLVLTAATVAGAVLARTLEDHR